MERDRAGPILCGVDCCCSRSDHAQGFSGVIEENGEPFGHGDGQVDRTLPKSRKLEQHQHVEYHDREGFHFFWVYIQKVLAADTNMLHTAVDFVTIVFTNSCAVVYPESSRQLQSKRLQTIICLCFFRPTNHCLRNSSCPPLFL